jgi:carboxypeptidase D
MPNDPKKVCYVYSALTTCSVAEMESLAEGIAVLKDWVVVGLGRATKDEMMK